MSVNLTLVVVAGVLIAAGVYLLTERTLTRILIGVMLAGNGVNLLFLVAGGPAGAAPFIDKLTGKPPAEPSDPLPQAMVLTAIVITLGVSAFLLALAYRSWRLTGEDEVPDDVEDSRVVRRALRAARLQANRTRHDAALARLAAGESISEDLRQALEDLEDDPHAEDWELPGADSEADSEDVAELYPDLIVDPAQPDHGGEPR